MISPKPIEHKAHVHATNNFHFIRLVAAILVIVTHSYSLNGLPEEDLMWSWTNQNFTFSYFGLMTFFIISGYLITQSAKPEFRMHFKGALSFLRKRFLRIFPALVVMVLLTILVLGPLLTIFTPGEYFSDPETWGYLKNLTLYDRQGDLPGVFLNYDGYPEYVNGSLWTLCYEFTLYLGVMLLAIFGALRWRYLMLVGFVFAFYKLSALPLHDPFEGLNPDMFLGLKVLAIGRFALFFFSGMMLYLFKDKIPMKFWIFASAVGLMIAGWWMGEGANAGLINNLCLPYIIIYLAQVPSRLNKFAEVGDFSYGMYIYAFPVQKLIAWYFPGLPMSIMIPYSILATLPFAILSWELVEKRFLGHRVKALEGDVVVAEKAVVVEMAGGSA
ncbi:MAG: acyltransferase [Patescibacteria group bacterium]